MAQGRPSLAFIVRPVPPSRLDLTVWALRRRGRNVIDRWDGVTYRRVIVVGGRPTEPAVRQAGSAATPRLIVTATPAPRTSSGRRRVRSTLDRLLGVRCPPRAADAGSRNRESRCRPVTAGARERLVARGCVFGPMRILDDPSKKTWFFDRVLEKYGEPDWTFQPGYPQLDRIILYEQQMEIVTGKRSEGLYH